MRRSNLALRRVTILPSGHERESCARSTDKPITEALLAILNSGVTNHLRGRTVAELIAIALVRHALQGDLQAIKEIADRTEGRVAVARHRHDNALQVSLGERMKKAEERFQQLRSSLSLGALEPTGGISPRPGPSRSFAAGGPAP